MATSNDGKDYEGKIRLGVPVERAGAYEHDEAPDATHAKGRMRVTPAGWLFFGYLAVLTGLLVWWLL